MDNKRPKPEEIVTKFRQVEVLTGQGMPRLNTIRQIGMTEQTITARVQAETEKRPVDSFPAKEVQRHGNRSVEGTEASSERERASEKGCF